MVLGTVSLGKVLIGDLECSIQVARGVRGGVRGKGEGGIVSIHTGRGGIH